MDFPANKQKESRTPNQPAPMPKGQGRIVAPPDKSQCLDTIQLNELEESFRQWTDASARRDIRLSRRRILLIFLIIRYTGGKLNEVLALDPFKDINHEQLSVLFHNAEEEATPREVQISEALSSEIRSIFADPDFIEAFPSLFEVDPGFVRRKFYERAEACGFPKKLGGPEMIRKARGVEMISSNVPLPAVQALLGHSTPNLTSSFVSFSEEEIQKVTKLFMERESSRKTSARNSFFGKIQEIQKGTIQAQVKLATTGGWRLTTLITNDSLEMLGLKEGTLVTAEVKAPWVILNRSEEEPACSAENRFKGHVEKITAGRVNAEYVVRLSDETRLCSIVSTESAQTLGLETGDPVWVLFNSTAVVLHSE